ncbi:MAG: hypothetical protein KDC92_08825, partial [Bacteroidetes bacterium]|nr:hypothetical protein [Bacteroidota bacterium]
MRSTLRHFCLVLLSIIAISANAQDTSKLLFYNVLGYNGNGDSRTQYLKTILDEAKPDIFMVCELRSSSAAIAIVDNVLNTNGETRFKRATFWDDGSLNNMLFYNGDRFRLVKTDTLNGEPRFSTVYFLLHKDAYENGDSIVFKVFISHLKAGNEDANAADRAKQVKRIRNYIDKET